MRIGWFEQPEVKQSNWILKIIYTWKPVKTVDKLHNELGAPRQQIIQNDIVKMRSVAKKWDLESQKRWMYRMPLASRVDQVRVRLHISERGFLYGQLRKSYFSLERLSYLGVWDKFMKIHNVACIVRAGEVSFEISFHSENEYLRS